MKWRSLSFSFLFQSSMSRLKSTLIDRQSNKQFSVAHLYNSSPSTHLFCSPKRGNMLFIPVRRVKVYKMSSMDMQLENADEWYTYMLHNSAWRIGNRVNRSGSLRCIIFFSGATAPGLSGIVALSSAPPGWSLSELGLRQHHINWNN
jgi:hypothetical protein